MRTRTIEQHPQEGGKNCRGALKDMLIASLQWSRPVQTFALLPELIAFSSLLTGSRRQSLVVGQRTQTVTLVTGMSGPAAAFIAAWAGTHA